MQRPSTTETTRLYHRPMSPNRQMMIALAVVLAWALGGLMASCALHGSYQVDRSRNVTVQGDGNTVIVTDVRPQIGLFNGD